MIDLQKKPIINGEKVILRPFEKEDFPLLEKILTEKVVITLTGSESDFDVEVTKEWYATRNDQMGRLDLAIVDRMTNHLVGEVVINEYDEANHSMNFRILIGEKGRNRGLGTEATQLLNDYIFSKTDLNQLTLSVFSFNSRAMHVYEKAGYAVESIDRNDLEYNGEMIDSINMKLTREKWLNKR